MEYRIRRNKIIDTYSKIRYNISLMLLLIKIRFKLSIYWKCQLIGCSLFFLIFSFVNLMFGGLTLLSLQRSLVAFSAGLTTSHLLRIYIKKNKVFENKFTAQIIYLLLLTILFSLLVSLEVWFIIYQLGIGNYPNTIRNTQGNFSRELFAIFLDAFPAMAIWALIYFLFQYVRVIRKEEQLKLRHEKELLELEARALRAQMNPHFIFNSLNTIKSLINKNENDIAATYLITFSKLVRILFQNSDRREISLFEELGSCNLYNQ